MQTYSIVSASIHVKLLWLTQLRWCEQAYKVSLFTLELRCNIYIHILFCYFILIELSKFPVDTYLLTANRAVRVGSMEGIGPLTNEREMQEMHSEFEKGRDEAEASMEVSGAEPGMVESTFGDSCDILPGNQIQYANDMAGGSKRKLMNSVSLEVKRHRVEDAVRVKNGESGILPQLSQVSCREVHVGDSQGGGKELPCVNSTLNSEGKKRVIIIKPLEVDGKSLVNNPIEMVSVLKESEFGKINMEDIRVNKRKGVIVVEAKYGEPLEVDKLTRINRLGKWPVKCYMPNNERFKNGVISPIELDVELEKVKESVQNQYRVVSITRLNKKNSRGQWEPSLALKVTFEEEELPRDLKIGYSYYKVQPYVSEPLRCYRCQRLGHTALGCNARKRCLKCGGEHLIEQCKSDTEKCANCKGCHTANSKRCRVYQTACDIEKEKALKQTTYEEARRRVVNLRNASEHLVTNRVNVGNKGLTESQSVVGTLTNVSLSYRDVVQTQEKEESRENRHDIQYRQNKYTSVGTQTECKVLNELDEGKFVKKLMAFMLEIFKGKFIEESDKDKKLVIENAIQNNFCVDVADDRLSGGAPHSRVEKQLPSKDSGGEQRGPSNLSVVGEEAPLEEVIINLNEYSSDNDEIWQTIEKRQVKMAAGKIAEKFKGGKQKKGPGKLKEKKGNN